MILSWNKLILRLGWSRSNLKMLLNSVNLVFVFFDFLGVLCSVRVWSRSHFFQKMHRLRTPKSEIPWPQDFCYIWKIKGSRKRNALTPHFKFFESFNFENSKHLQYLEVSIINNALDSIRILTLLIVSGQLMVLLQILLWRHIWRFWP